MNNKEIWFGIVGIVIGVLIVWLFGPAMWPGYMMRGGSGWNNLNGDQIGRTMGINLDRYFIEQMIPHHEGAIAMANLALEKAIRPEIKTLAKEIISAQEVEINEMKVWYKNWFSRNVPEGSVTMMGGMHMGGQEEVKALTDAIDFDKAFIESMIPHHQLAIMMAQMLKAGTDKPEMLLLAENIIESQNTEIEKMEGWYNNWYK